MFGSARFTSRAPTRLMGQEVFEMAGKEVWVGDIAELVIEAECVRVRLESGGQIIPLRMARKTLIKGIDLGRRALAGKATKSATIHKMR